MNAAVLRGVAAGIGAGVGIAISVGVLVTMAILQSLKLIGYAVWPTPEVILIVVLAALIGILWGLGTFKAYPSVGRGLAAGLMAFSAAALAVLLVRWLFDFSDPWAPGTVFVAGGFAAAFGTLWGMGATHPDYETVEAAQEAEHHPHKPAEPVAGAFNTASLARHSFGFLRERILPIVRPLLGPLVIAFGVALLGVVIVMLIGTFGPSRVQTTDLSASAVTPSGYLAGVTLFGQPVSKLAFFAFVVLLIFGGIASLAIGLALLINALSAQVQLAKKSPNEPIVLSDSSPQHGPLVTFLRGANRLVHFFTDWIADITLSILRMVSRQPSA